jgi:hypothetical protein
MRVILAGLTVSRNACLVGIVPKFAELSIWRPRFSRLVCGNEVERIVLLTNELLADVQPRAEFLATTQTAKLQPTGARPWNVLVIDEWVELDAAGDLKQRAHTITLLRRYLSLGRGVGCTAP